MIPVIRFRRILARHRLLRTGALAAALMTAVAVADAPVAPTAPTAPVAATAPTAPTAPTAAPVAPVAPVASVASVAPSAGNAPAAGVSGTGTPGATAAPAGCLSSGDGYLRAHVAGAIDARIDWPNSGTQCQGEPKSQPPGVRLSFQRIGGGKPNLLFLFGLTGVREGQPAHATGVNLTVILQGTNRIFGTLGDSRCTVDSLTQRPLQAPGAYRVEARGFCTQPAHAVRGDGDVLVSTFEFAGPVNYGTPDPSDLKARQ